MNVRVLPAATNSDVCKCYACMCDNETILYSGWHEHISICKIGNGRIGCMSSSVLFVMRLLLSRRECTRHWKLIYSHFDNAEIAYRTEGVWIWRDTPKKWNTNIVVRNKTKIFKCNIFCRKWYSNLLSRASPFLTLSICILWIIQQMKHVRIFILLKSFLSPVFD